MDALILAAGRGTRLQPLTDKLPKPLIEVHGLCLIEIHLIRLASAGFKRVIINLHHLGALIKARLGDGQHFGLQILYSEETDAALETLQSALESSGYVSGQGLNGSQLFIATQLANALDLGRRF